MWKRLVTHTSLQCRGCNTFSRFSQLSYCSAKPLLSELMATKISRGDEYFVAWTVFHGFFFSFNSLRNSLLGKVSLIMETRNITGNEGREMWHWEPTAGVGFSHPNGGLLLATWTPCQDGCCSRELQQGSSVQELLGHCFLPSAASPQDTCCARYCSLASVTVFGFFSAWQK